MLTFENVSAGYGKKTVLQNVTFSLKPHAVTAILGPNGSGKSTLLGCVGRSVAYAGKIRIDGEDLAGMRGELRARRVSLLMQSLPAVSLTVAELVAFGRVPYMGQMQRLKAVDKEKIAQALIAADVCAFRDTPVAQLSGGERQRAYFAMTLAQDTPLMLLDEPTTYMDVSYQTAFVRDLIGPMRGAKTIGIVMHDLAAAVRVADEVLLLKAGRAVFHGPTQEALDAHAIEDVFAVHRHDFSQDAERYYVFD